MSVSLVSSVTSASSVLERDVGSRERSQFSRETSVYLLPSWTRGRLSLVGKSLGTQGSISVNKDSCLVHCGGENSTL